MGPQLYTNIDRLYSRSSVFLGSLVQLNPKHADMKCELNTSKQHNMVPLGSTAKIRRFQLLPIAMPNLSESRNSSVRTSRTVKSNRVRPIAEIHLSKARVISSKKVKAADKSHPVSGIGSKQTSHSSILDNASSLISGIWSST